MFCWIDEIQDFTDAPVRIKWDNGPFMYEVEEFVEKSEVFRLVGEVLYYHVEQS